MQFNRFLPDCIPVSLWHLCKPDENLKSLAQLQIGLTWFFGGLAILVLTSCAAKVDPILVESSLSDTQQAISEARRLGAEEYATELLTRAMKLFDEAQQARRTGNGMQSTELALRAQAEAQIASARARQQIAQKRIDDARTEVLKVVAREMEYKIQMAQVRQAIAEERTKQALSRAIRAEQRASAAQAEADEARNDAQNALHRSQTQLTIARIQLTLDVAKEAGALTYAATDYQGAENLINQARSLLAQDNFDEARSAAAQAESRANEAKISTIAGANAAASQSQAAKLQSHTNAKVAITRAQLEIDRAESVNAFEYAASLFQRAKTTRDQANMALKKEQYDQALRLAAQAESSARDAYAIAEVADRKHREKEALEEQAAQAKDAIFKAEEVLNRVASMASPTVGPQHYEQAKSLLADAQQALANENYSRAIETGRQSAVQLTVAIERAKQIEVIETEILNHANAIPGVETNQTKKGVLIRFSGQLFEQGSSEINPKSFPMISQLAEVIKAFADYDVRIEGHSDSIGDADVNLKLTKKRANVFTKYLAGKCSVPPGRMTSIGLGENYPIADNRSKAGRGKNRRIDTIILTRE